MATQTPEKTRRARTRIIEERTAPNVQDVPENVRELMLKCYESNLVANAAGNVYKKARPQLLAAMMVIGRKVVDATFNTTDKEGKAITLSLTAEVAGKPRSEIDVEKLLKLTDIKTIVRMASISVEDVKKELGAVVAAQCTVAVTTAENVSVGTKKQ